MRKQGKTKTILYTTTLGVFALLVALIVSVGNLPAEQRRSTVLREVFQTWAPVGDTWSEVLGNADTVARVKLVGKRYRVLDDDTYVITQYRAEVLEYFKTDNQASGRTLELYRRGGVIKNERGQRIKYSSRGFPDYLLEEEYVVFLQWDRNVGAYATMGPNATFRLDRAEDRVVTPGTSQFARAQYNRTIDSMLARIRSASQ